MAAVVKTLTCHGVMRIKGFSYALHADDEIPGQSSSAHAEGQNHKWGEEPGKFSHTNLLEVMAGMPDMRCRGNVRLMVARCRTLADVFLSVSGRLRLSLRHVAVEMLCGISSVRLRHEAAEA